MFANEYKKRCEALTEELNRLQCLIEDISKSNDKLHLIKYVVNNADQFMLDGEYVYDDTSPVYGSHSVSFSEAVMFKAGKEAAKREFDTIQANSELVISQLKDKLANVEQELLAEKNYVEELINNIRSLNDTHSQAVDQMRSDSKELLNELDSERSINQQLLSEKDGRICELENELQKWREGEMVDDPLPIITSYGIVEA